MTPDEQIAVIYLDPMLTKSPSSFYCRDAYKNATEQWARESDYDSLEATKEDALDHIQKMMRERDELATKLTEAEQLITDLKNHQKVLEELYESAWRETSKYRDVMVMHHGLFNDIIELAKQNVTVPEVQKVPWKRFGSDSNDNH